MIFRFKGSQLLKKEISAWEDEQLITPEQAEKLSARYELDKDPPWFLRASFIIKSIALLMGAAGVLLFISENWHHLGIPARMANGLVPLLTCYVFGIIYLRKGKNDEAELALFMASLLFGINIMLQAQIFHIEKYFPDAFLWWLIGILPLAFYFKGTLLKITVNIIYLVWIGCQVEYSQMSLMSPLIFAAIVYLLYRKPNNVLLLTVIACFYIFVLNLISWLDWRQSYISFFSAFCLLVIALLNLVRHQYDELFLSRIHRAAAISIIFIFYLFTFDDAYGDFARHGISPVTYTGLGISLLLFLFLSKKSTINWLLFALVALQTGAHLLGWLYLEDEHFVSKDVTGPATIFLNLVFLATSIGIIRAGLLNKSKRRFMLGVLMILALALGRYFNYFEDYVITAIVFILCSILLLVINYIWNRNVSK